MGKLVVFAAHCRCLVCLDRGCRAGACLVLEALFQLFAGSRTRPFICDLSRLSAWFIAEEVPDGTSIHVRVWMRDIKPAERMETITQSSPQE